MRALDNDTMYKMGIDPYDYGVAISCDNQDKIIHYVLLNNETGEVKTYTAPTYAGIELIDDRDEYYAELAKILKDMKYAMKGGDPYGLYPDYC